MLEWLFGKKKQQPEEPQQKKKPKKNQAQQQAEDKWMYQFVVQFLNSPIWRVSILDFVDTRCVVFDNEQQNKFEYTTIHNVRISTMKQFKQLVGNLFDGMMKEVGLTEDKLVQILEKGFMSKEKKLFHQLLLCDDFLKFKDLMLRRNKALETEAMHAMNNSDIRKKSKIQKERDMIRQSQIQESSRIKKVQQQEEEILRKVLEMSKKQAEEREVIEKLEIQAAQLQIQKTVEKEKLESQKQIKQEKTQDKTEDKTEEKNEQEEAVQLKSKVNRKKKLNPIGEKSKQSDLPPLKSPPRKQFVEEDTPIISNSEQKKQQIKKEERTEQKHEQSKVEAQQDRKKRLMEQRERIKKKKEEERRKMMEDETSSNERKVTNIVLQDDGIHDSTFPHEEKESEEKVASEQVERRKALMKKIKNRIVDDF